MEYRFSLVFCLPFYPPFLIHLAKVIFSPHVLNGMEMDKLHSLKTCDFKAVKALDCALRRLILSESDESGGKGLPG